MTVAAVLGGVGVLVVVALAYLVGRLHAEIRRLGDEVAHLRAAAVDDTAVPVTATTSSAADETAAPVVLPAMAPAPDDDVVPLITHPTDDGIDLRTTRIASITLGRPLIKAAALSHGVRRALSDEHRFRIRYEMRRELRRQRKLRRRRRSGQAPSMGWRR